jgi:hypothetical protein
MKPVILAGLVAWPVAAGAQQSPAQFNDAAKRGWLFFETAGEAYGCGLRSDQWVAYTLSWTENNVATAAWQAWPTTIANGKPIDMTAAAMYNDFHQKALAGYRLGLADSPAECVSLNNSGVLQTIDLVTGFVP